MGNFPAHIEDEAAYANAVDRKIKENARKGRGARWLKEDPTRNELVEFLFREGSKGGFLGKMFVSYEDWGSLTPGQEAAVRKIMSALAAKNAEYAARDSGSLHVGTVGERSDWTLTIRAVSSFEGDFGLTYIYIMEDDAKNVVVYKGSSRLGDGKNTFAGKGSKVTGKATVKCHGDRDGVKQTYLSRPKFTIIL